MKILLRTLFILISTGSLFCLEIKKVQSHAIESKVIIVNGNLRVKSRFSNGAPMKGATVLLLNSKGENLVKLGKTNEKGEITFKIPSIIKNADLELKIDGGPGHTDYLLLPVRSGQIKLNEIVKNLNSTTSNKQLTSTRVQQKIKA